MTLTHIFLIFLASRLFFIVNLPPFTDESLYIRWGLLAIDNPAYRWASLTYLERQPLMFWLFGYGAKMLGNALVGARLITLILSIPTFFAFWGLSKTMLNNTQSKAALMIFSMTPLFILLQSLALMDGAILSLSILLFFMVIRYKITQSIWSLVLAGVLLGILMWIKTTSLFVVGLYGISIFIISWKQKQSIILGAWRTLVPFLVMGIVLMPLISRPESQSLLNESGHFALTPGEILGLPFMLWAQNGLILLVGFAIYFTPVGLLLIPAGFRHIHRNNRMLLLLWIMVPIGISLITGKLFRFRYFACSLPLVIPFIAAAFQKTWLKTVTLISFGVFSVILIVFPRIFFGLFPAHIPKLMEREYAYGWTAGYGVRDAIQYIDEHIIKNANITVLAVPDSSGNPSDYIVANYFYHPTVRTTIVTTTNEKDFLATKPVTDKAAVYLVARQSLITPEIQRYLKQVMTFQPSAQEEHTGIYKIVF